ncbi:MAG: reverse transcriptase family protein, partial [Oscillospiraceae bacterium]
SGKTFQRLMNLILEGAESYCLSHVDDIVIFSQTWEDHMKHIRDVLQRLKDANLTANRSKSQFAKNKIKILGHVLEDGKILPDPEKTKAISEFPTPRTKKQVKAFVGLANFYRSFVNNFAEIARPLTDLTRRDLPDKVQWEAQHELAFQQLKDSLCTGPVLIPPDPTRSYILKSDACKNCIASVLLQTNDAGEEHPVAYASRKLLPNEVNHSTVEHELLGIVWGLAHFEHYTYGADIEVRTDHYCLRWLNKMANQNPRLTRWALVSQRYNIDKVTYVPGKQLGDADGLSRADA